jgi:hypothetical protein
VGDCGVGERVLPLVEDGGAVRAERGGLAEPARVVIQLGELGVLQQQSLDLRLDRLRVGVARGGTDRVEDAQQDAHPEQLGHEW